MRLIVIASSISLCTVATIIACSPEEFPNPPATRDGTESTTSGGPSSLPGESDPDKGKGGTSTSSSGSSGNVKDGATKDVSTVPTDPGPTSGLDGTKTVSELTQAEKTLLCDWQAAKTGGYGTKTKCDGGLTLTNHINKYDCIADYPAGCQATVTETEACVNKNAEDLCALAVFNAPECEPLRECAAAAADAGADAN